APKYIKQLLTDIKGEIDSNTIIVGDFNTPLTPMDRSSKQKVNKETLALKDTLDQMDLVYIYRTFHPKTTEYTFFSNAHGTFSRIDHILGHKTSLNKFKKIEIIPYFFSDHKGMKLEINYRKKIRKATNLWRLNKMLLNNDWVNEEIKRQIQKYPETNENENMTCQNLWDTAKAAKREVYSNSGLPQQRRKIPNR
ncbi:13508_t:CDS:1, partial [Gigaspora margarita]